MPEQDDSFAPPPAIPLQELVKTKLLIGEGQDEVHFFGALLKHLELTEIQVEGYAGKAKLQNYLAALIKRPGFANIISLGVTRDADDDARGGHDSVREALKRTGLAAPNTHAVFEQGEPQVGVFILPDGQSKGMLEDLCLSSLAGDPTAQCLSDYFDCIERRTGRLPTSLSKARIHAWLSGQDKPDLRLGLAAEKGLLDWTNPAFDPIKAFLRSL